MVDRADAGRAHEVDSQLVVEWRALTVALLDRLAEIIRKRLGRNADSLPLASLLQSYVVPLALAALALLMTARLLARESALTGK